jgi:MFS-type transporter involved in bile tolerance (Atg22 family)
VSWMWLIFCSAVISALIGGRLSDKFGAKKIVYISCSMTCIAVLLIILPWFHTLGRVLGVSLLFGAGINECFFLTGREIL